jgi:DNA ligase 1
MRYVELANVYRELENQASKLKKATIVAEFLNIVPSELLKDVVLLLGGNIYPKWGEEETGVAGQLMIKAISKASGEEQSEVVKYFTTSGDLGKTVGHFLERRKQQSLGVKELTVEKVVTNLREIAKQEGGGSQERKMNLIAELLISATPEEGKYIVKTVLGELRVGVAEGIIRDGIAEAYGIDKKIVEGAWFLNQDYGEVAKIGKDQGEDGLLKVKVVIGKPIAVALAEKSPTLEEAVEKFEKPVFQKKFDGMRTQIHKDGDRVEIFTRRLENVTKQFPELVDRVREQVKVDNVILDGETLAFKDGKPMPFQFLSQRIKRKYNIGEISEKIPVKTEIFDVVCSDGAVHFDKPLEERRKILESIVKPSGVFHVTNEIRTKDVNIAKEYYNDTLKEGHEGLIVKNLEATYQAGRRVAGGWLKVKPVMENLDLVIIGGTWGTGKRTGWIGSLTLGCRDKESGGFLECGMLGSGLKEKGEGMTMEKLTELLRPLILKEKDNSVWFKPKMVIEVAYEEIQKSPTYSSGYALRFPRLVRFREDKGIYQADDLKRVEKLFSIQKGGQK